jgi:hypothetical protein
MMINRALRLLYLIFPPGCSAGWYCPAGQRRPRTLHWLHARRDDRGETTGLLPALMTRVSPLPSSPGSATPTSARLLASHPTARWAGATAWPAGTLASPQPGHRSREVAGWRDSSDIRRGPDGLGRPPPGLRPGHQARAHRPADTGSPSGWFLTRTRRCGGLCPNGSPPPTLKLIETKTTDTGVVIHVCQPAGKPELGAFAPGQE